MRTNKKWTTTDVKLLKEKYPIMTVAELASMLGRTDKSIKGAVQTFKVKKSPESNTKINTKWEQWQVDILLAEYDSTNETTEKIARKIGKSKYACIAKASRVGVSKPSSSMRGVTKNLWKFEEVKIIRTGWENDKPAGEIYQELCEWATKNNCPIHPQGKFVIKLRQIGLKPYVYDDCEYYSIAAISLGFGCSETTARQLVKKFEKVLKPEKSTFKTGKPWIVKAKNLKRFILDFPGEVAQYKPDLVWIVEVLR